MPCPESTSKIRRRFVFALTPPELVQIGCFCPDLPCACELCHLAAVMPCEYTPGCKCDDCRHVHRVLLTLRDAHAHLPRAKLYTARKSGWQSGEDCRVYAEVHS